MGENGIRVLRIVSVMNRGGIETQIMNMYRKLDRSKCQFDFLVTREEFGVFDEEIENLGGRIYRVPSIRKVGLLKFIKNINDFFKEHKEYKIVHSHMNTWSGLFLNIAKYHNIPVRIAQSHSAQQGYKNHTLKGVVENYFKRVMKLFIKSGATHFWAVGKAAGEWLYGEKIAQSKMKIVPNAKDLNEYKYDAIARDQLRNELGISKDAIVIGHVGSFSPVKNHELLIELFNDLKKKVDNSYLCLVGDGPLRRKVEEKITDLDITSNVLILGQRNDVNKLMSMFDVLVLPSLFEGMPNVVIEAQAAALPCVVSDSVTREIDMEMGIIKFISLNKSVKAWNDAILNIAKSNRLVDTKNISKKGYDLESVINFIEDFYKRVI
jgi:glycosyltransferase involved in cell wall biosynthesis